MAKIPRRHGLRKQRTQGHKPLQIIPNPQNATEERRNWAAIPRIFDDFQQQIDDVQQIVPQVVDGIELERFVVVNVPINDAAQVERLFFSNGAWNTTGDKYWAVDWTPNSRYLDNLRQIGTTGWGKVSTDITEIDIAGTLLPVLEIVNVDGLARFIEYTLATVFQGQRATGIVRAFWGEYPNSIDPGEQVVLFDRQGIMGTGTQGDRGVAILDESLDEYIPIVPPPAAPSGGPFTALYARATASGTFTCPDPPPIDSDGFTFGSPPPFTVPWDNDIDVTNPFGYSGEAGDALLFQWISGEAVLVDAKRKFVEAVIGVNTDTGCGLEYRFVNACIHHTSSADDLKREVYAGVQLTVVTALDDSNDQCVIDVKGRQVCVPSTSTPVDVPLRIINWRDYCLCCNQPTPQQCTCDDLPAVLILEILGCSSNDGITMDRQGVTNNWLSRFPHECQRVIGYDNNDNPITQLERYSFRFECDPGDFNQPALFLTVESEPGWQGNVGPAVDVACNPSLPVDYQAVWGTESHADLHPNLFPNQPGQEPPPGEPFPGWCQPCRAGNLNDPGDLVVFVVRTPQ